jgi:hypothetical protein
MLNAELTLAKIVLQRGELGAAVLAELSAHHVDEQSMRLAISGALEGVKRVRQLMGSVGNAVLPPGK